MNESKPIPMRLPTLPTALRLYLLVVLGTLGITYGLSSVVPDVPFLRLITAVFVVGGLLGALPAPCVNGDLSTPLTGR